MRSFAVIPAAGELKGFWKPVPLLSLGRETIISRLLKQLRRAEVYPLVAVGSPGEHGWVRSHVDEFKRIPLWKVLLTAPYPGERGPLRNIEFLLKYLNDNLNANPKSKVFIIFADWIFSDSLLVETLSYPAPSLFSHIFDEWGIIIRVEDIPAFLNFSKKFQEVAYLLKDKKGLKALGFRFGLGSQKNAPDRFCEVDLIRHYELAFKLVYKEWVDPVLGPRPLRRMEDWAVIPAAGGVYRHFWRPRALLTLGEETLIQRLVRQFKENDICPVVGIGKAGPREGKGKFRADLPWSKGNVDTFEKLSCEVLVTPYHNERGPLKTIIFLIEYLLKNFDLKGDSRVYIAYGDYVFSDRLFKEMLAYSAPCYSFLKKRDGFVGILTGEILKDFVALVSQWPDISSPLILHETVPEGLKAIGLKEVSPVRLPGPDFIEIDDPGSYEHAIKLVFHEIKSRVW